MGWHGPHEPSGGGQGLGTDGDGRGEGDHHGAQPGLPGEQPEDSPSSTSESSVRENSEDSPPRRCRAMQTSPSPLPHTKYPYAHTPVRPYTRIRVHPYEM